MANEFSGRKNVPTHKKARRAGMRAARLAAAQSAAAERQAAHNKLSTKEKLAKLDLILGAGLGAVRERARLNALLVQEAQKAQQATSEVQRAAGTSAEEKPQKKASKGKKTK